MTAKHTLTHAILYLEQAIDRSHDVTSLDALRMSDPGKPCAAYVLARRTLKRCGSLDAAIKDLESQPEQS